MKLESSVDLLRIFMWVNYRARLQTPFNSLYSCYGSSECLSWASFTIFAVRQLAAGVWTEIVISARMRFETIIRLLVPIPCGSWAGPVQKDPPWQLGRTWCAFPPTNPGSVFEMVRPLLGVLNSLNDLISGFPFR